MKRVGFVLKVKQDRLEEYKEHHKNVWPEMRAALSRTGWGNYSLFLRNDGMLFGYVETADSLEASLAGMAKEPINAKWQAVMTPFFEALSGDRPDESFVVLEEIFHLD